MATARHDDNDGSDIFWPGYVDATTNLILNLLFLLTILIVAVFMFALELGRTSKIEAVEQAENATKPVTAIVQPAVTAETTDTIIEENRALKREVERLNLLLSQRATEHGGGGVERTVEASLGYDKPQSGLDETIASNFEVMVRFKDEAVTFTPEEHAQLLESLKATRESQKTSIYVEVPAGFSEAKRMGFYRAMAVRNLLIEMNIPGEQIEVSVVEGSNKANASLVRVRAN